MRTNQCGDPDEIILPALRVKGRSPITTIVVGENHNSIQAPLLLKHLHPHISHIFRCHLAEYSDDASEIVYITYMRSMYKSIINAYEAIRIGLIHFNNNNSTRHFRPFEAMHRYPLEAELHEVNKFLNLSITKNIIYRMSRVDNSEEYQALINISKQLNFSIAGIDDSHARQRIEACLMSDNTTCFRYLLDLLESVREQTMLGHLTRYHESQKNCTAILGNTHVAHFMNVKNLNQDTWMILRPYYSISNYDMEGGLFSSLNPLQLVENAHQQHVYAYNIRTEVEAEKAAIAIAKYINASHGFSSPDANSICRNFISESIDLQIVLMNSIFHGAIHGIANLAKLISETRKKSHTAFKAQCMVYLIGYFLFSYYEKREKVTLSDNTLNTAISAVFNAIVMTMLNIFLLCVSGCLHYAKEKINKNGWKKTGYALQKFGEYGKYAFFAMNASQHGIEAVTTAVAAGCAIQNTIEYTGKAILNRVIK